MNGSTMKNPNKPKLYLAKSNMSDPNLIMQVRALLNELELELVEFSGGSYSDKPLLSCDHLLVIPPNPKQEDPRVGRGLSEQIRDFEAKNDTTIFIFDHIEDDAIYIREFLDQDLIQRDWKENWAAVNTRNFDPIDIINYGLIPKTNTRYGLESPKVNIDWDKGKSGYVIIKPKPMLAAYKYFKL